MFKKIVVGSVVALIFLGFPYAASILAGWLFGDIAKYLVIFGSIATYAIYSYKFAVGKRKAEEALRVAKEHGVAGEYRVFHTPDLSPLGCLYAATLTQIKTILVDDAFLALPETYRSFIIQHEIGHLDLGHCGVKNNLIKRIINSWMGKVMEIELEADAFAAERVGREVAIEALAAMKSGKKAMKRELDRRIAALQTV